MEMTTTYQLTMAARHLDFTCNNASEVITDANLQLLSNDAYESMRTKAKRKPTFETEADVHHIQAIMADYRDDMRSTRNNQMETILEEEEFQSKPCMPKPMVPTSADVDLSLEDTNHLNELKRILAAREIEPSFEKRLREIIQQYSEQTAKRGTVDDAALAWSLSLLRDEVQAHIVQRHLRSERRTRALFERVCGSQRFSRLKAIRDKLERNPDIWSNLTGRYNN